MSASIAATLYHLTLIIPNFSAIKYATVQTWFMPVLYNFGATLTTSIV